MKKIFTLFLFLLFLSIGSNAGAQLTGTKSIPGDYPSIAAAITALNAGGVGSGGVIFNVAAGHTEVTSNAVMAITVNQPTASNPVVFQKAGAGANPLITAAPGVSPSLDGCIILSGADYITFDGIDVIDPPANIGDTMMEWGYALLRASATDGCQNVVIKNCTITLQKINLSSIGIYIVNRNLAGTTITATDPAGQNSNNRLFGNNISNVYKGINVISASTARDENNEVGVIGETANSVTNYGGSTTATEGIRCEGQVSVKINNNIINGGAGTTNSVYGIIATLFGTSANAPNYEVSNNKITVQGNSTTTLSHAVRCLASGDTVRILNNIIENCSMSNTSATFAGITHDGTSNTVFMIGNIVRNNTHTSTGTFNHLASTSTVTNLYIHSNKVYDNTKSGTGTVSLIAGTGTVANLSIRLNEVYENQITGASGTMNCIQAGTAAIECDSNIVSNNSIPNSSGATACAVYGYVNSASPTFENVYNNLFYNLSVGGTGTSASSIVAGIRSNAAAGSVKEIYGNYIHHLSGISGTSATGGVYGIWSTAGSGIKIYDNIVFHLTNNGTTGTAAGCWANSGAAIEVYNNFVSGVYTPNSTNNNAVVGINFTSTATNSTIKAYYNTVYLDASGGSTFGSSGLSAAGSATATTAALDMRNNIIINLSTPGSTSGFTAAYRRNNVNLPNYSSASDYNNFYAGTPSANRVIFYDGTNSDQTLAAYKIRVSPRDANSVSVTVDFLNTAAGNLHLGAGSNGDMDLAGTPVSGITTDIDGDSRNEVVPYMGADEGSIPLPVELTSFTASVNRRDVHLSWTTASEMNNSGFDIERKADGNEAWAKAGFIQGAGTTGEAKNYSYTDKGLNAGKYSYRLKQLDYNGNYEYYILSSEIIIGIPEKYDLSQNYPNPFNPVTKINFDLPFDSKVAIKVFDITGREIATLVNDVQPAGYYTVTFDAMNIASGMYFYRITAEGGSQQYVMTKKMMVIK